MRQVKNHFAHEIEERSEKHFGEACDFKTAIHDYVDLHSKLLRVFEESRGCVCDWNSSWGRSIINVELEGDYWLCQWHGMGIDGTLVDPCSMDIQRLLMANRGVSVTTFHR